MSTARIGPLFFRREYGRLVAMLSRRVGVGRIEAVEDAVQCALMTAVELWPRSGVPENPSAWLFRVAHNSLVEELRRRARREGLLERHYREGNEPSIAQPIGFPASDVHDELLRMLFICCDESIPIESQLVLALKTLCGFGTREIAERLFLTEANVYKRLGRARTRLREVALTSDDLTAAELAPRLKAVHAIIYLLFTEGYLSSEAESAIRQELCEEALRLAHILVEHRVGKSAETFALLALMHLHHARMSARTDASGGLLLLEEQDRALWDAGEIAIGLAWLARSAEGEVFSRYHAEAGIAAEHCLAPSIAATRWDRIVDCYALLERTAPSPIHTLNRAVAVAEWRGPAEGLAVLEGLEPPTCMSGSYLWKAVLADLHRRSGHEALALRYRKLALASAPTPALKELLRRRLSTTA